MSLGYCYYCLEPEFQDNDDCPSHGDKTIYGELRVQYLRGYRDAEEGKEENI